MGREASLRSRTQLPAPSCTRSLLPNFVPSPRGGYPNRDSRCLPEELPAISAFERGRARTNLGLEIGIAVKQSLQGGPRRQREVGSRPERKT